MVKPIETVREVIWKFKLPKPYESKHYLLSLSEFVGLLDAPYFVVGWTFLSLQMQQDEPVMWVRAEVHTELPHHLAVTGYDPLIRLSWRMTGETLFYREKYLGTLQFDNGLVWHLMESPK